MGKNFAKQEFDNLNDVGGKQHEFIFLVFGIHHPKT